MPLTAVCIEPSGPRSASPGPRIAHSVAFTTVSSSRPMMSVVTTRYSVCVIASACSSNGTSVSPYQAKPASRAADVEMDRQLHSCPHTACSLPTCMRVAHGEHSDEAATGCAAAAGTAG
eukprot:scaffold4648_cov148-Isochrysis_galbana.AAC.3